MYVSHNVSTISVTVRVRESSLRLHPINPIVFSLDVEVFSYKEMHRRFYSDTMKTNFLFTKHAKHAKPYIVPHWVFSSLHHCPTL